MRNSIMRKLGAAVLAASLTLGLAACGGSADSGKEEINIGFIPSWTDGRSTAYLLANQLEKMGYKVKMTELSEPGPLYTGLAKGDIDIYPSAWSDVTHASYMKKYGDKIEDLGTYYDNAKLTWAVPEYSKMKSIEDIKANADKVGSKVIGIEPGAGLTKISKEKVIPEYGLNNFQLVTSSTTAMLAELKKATEKKQEIVVTLWRPFWANSKFKVRDLEDPKGALGGSEGLHFLASKGFSEKHKDVADWVSKVKLDDAQYGGLEDTVVNKFGEGKEKEAIEAWIKENPDVLEFVK